MQLMIPVQCGLEQVVKRQLTQMGYSQNPCENGRIRVEGDWLDVARLNVNLRSGERVLICLDTFQATTFDELFDGVYRIPWEDYLSPHSLILMDGKSQKSQLGAIKAIGSVSKKAIIRRLIDKRQLNTATLDERGDRTIVGIALFEDRATVTIDTSGDGLHKRGYRDLAYTAPLKETTAAGLIDMTYYFPDKPFADLFCGSGTLPIEAAMKAWRIAPGLKRHFDFENWKCAPNGVLKTAREEAESLERRHTSLSILASDIDPKAVSIARHHAKAAGVEKAVTFKVADMKDFRSFDRYGVLISNPPYGERLNSISEVQELYRELGKMFRSLPDWNGYFLTGYPEFERYFGKRADKCKKLSNANIECGFYSYLSRKPQ